MPEFGYTVQSVEPKYETHHARDYPLHPREIVVPVRHRYARHDYRYVDNYTFRFAVRHDHNEVALESFTVDEDTDPDETEFRHFSKALAAASRAVYEWLGASGLRGEGYDLDPAFSILQADSDNADSREISLDPTGGEPDE
jgi:hypothetical protein